MKRRIYLGSIAGAVGATAVYPIDLGMNIYSNKFEILFFISLQSKLVCKINVVQVLLVNVFIEIRLIVLKKLFDMKVFLVYIEVRLDRKIKPIKIKI